MRARRTSSPATSLLGSIPASLRHHLVAGSRGVLANAVAVDSDGSSTTSPAVSVRVDAAPNERPAVTLTTPVGGTTYTAPATVVLSADASDPDNGVARVEFYSGAILLGAASSPPYSFTWSAVPAEHTAASSGVDAAGASSASGR